MPDKYDIITIGAAVQDVFLWLQRDDVVIFDNPSGEPTRKELMALEYGAKINAARSAQSFGGGAFNTAVTFSRLGFKTGVVTALGCDDAAEAIVNSMNREGLAPDFISHHSTRRTGFSVIIEAGIEKEHVVIVERGANNLLSFSPTKKGLGSASWYYLTSLTGDSWAKTLEKIAGTVRRKKINWAWNPGNAQLAAGFGFLGRFLKHCTVFIVNRDEALELLRGEDRQTEDDIRHLLNSLLHWGPKMVIITDGRDGAYYADKQKILHVSADKDLEVVESTGAGDSFGSGFVAGLLMTKMANIPYALDAAMHNAESVLGKIGAQDGILRLDELKRLLLKKKHKIKKV